MEIGRGFAGSFVRDELQKGRCVCPVPDYVRGVLTKLKV